MLFDIANTIDRIARNPFEWDGRGYGACDHARRELWLGCKAGIGGHVCGFQPIWILAPFLRKIQRAINQRMTMARNVGREHADLAVCDLAGGTSVLPRHSARRLALLEAHGIDGYVAPGRAKHPTAANGKIGGPLTQRMRKKIDDGGFETPYRLRKQVVEPVFGQIKQARGFRQFLLRGVEKVRAEWAMICTAHNLLKLFTLTQPPPETANLPINARRNAYLDGLLEAESVFDVNTVFAGIIILTMFAILLDAAVTVIENKVLVWRPV